MGQALYRKHRSKSLSEIVGQEHITTALETALKTDRISHAYLFTGPRGTGKTSIARILAHAINDLPYSTDPHLDIIEIDAASNRRIDEIRDLRDKVYIAPTSAKYKVYIIDEVHMLTREAFNALLKTLEEPPAHVVFILATTDAHKLPETIVSRTQRYNFRPVDLQKVSDHLAHIAKLEGITIDKDALELLATHGQGSFRDSISMLDQVSNHQGTVSLDAVRTQLGIPSEEAVSDLLNALRGNEISQLIIKLQSMFDAGFRAPAIAEQLAEHLRTQLTNGANEMPATIVLHLLKQLLGVAGAHNPERFLEIILMEALTPQLTTTKPIAAVAAPKPQPAPVHKPAPTKAATDPKVAPKSKATPEPEPETAAKPEPRQVVVGQLTLNDENWAAVLTELKKQYNTIYGIVRMAKTDFSEPGTVTLGFSFAFHQKRINDAKNRKIVTDTILTVTGQNVHLICTLASAPTAVVASTSGATAAPDKDKLQDITSVFGGAELL